MMKKYLRNLSLITAGLLSLGVLHMNASDAGDSAMKAGTSPSPWSFDVVPYLWLATYGGTFDLPGAPIGIGRTRSTSSDPFSTHISAAAMLTAQVHYHDVGLFLDGAWLQLKTDGDAPPTLYSGTEIKTDIAYGTMALTYRLQPLGKLQTELLAGARVWHVSNEIDVKPGTEPGATFDGSRTWVDPILGATLRYDFCKRWYAIVLGDAGGFSVGSDFSWNVYGGVGYRFTDWCSATLGYRYLHVDYENNGFLMNANVQGFLLGVGFHF